MPRQVVIANPIINSPFDEPQRHFRFDDDGITDDIVDQRRSSSYFVPIAKPKTKGKAKKYGIKLKGSAGSLRKRK